MEWPIGIRKGLKLNRHAYHAGHNASNRSSNFICPASRFTKTFHAPKAKTRTGDKLIATQHAVKLTTEWAVDLLHDEQACFAIEVNSVQA